MCSTISIDRKFTLRTPFQFVEYFRITQLICFVELNDGRDFDPNGCLCQIEVEQTLIQYRILFTYDDVTDTYHVSTATANNILHSLN